MTANNKSLDDQINFYIQLLNTSQKQVLLSVAKTFAEKQTDNDYTNELKAELDNRYEEYINGAVLVCEQDVNARLNTIINKNKLL